jgi:Superinfection immunity protein
MLKQLALSIVLISAVSLSSAQQLAPPTDAPQQSSDSSNVSPANDSNSLRSVPDQTGQQPATDQTTAPTADVQSQVDAATSNDVPQRSEPLTTDDANTKVNHQPDDSTANSRPSIGILFLGVVLIVGGFILYWLPTILARRRHHNNALSITLVNFFFGWTFIGWVVALVWSASDNVPAAA